MSLRDDLKKTTIEAAKAKDQVLLDTVRSVQSAVKYKEIDKQKTLDDAEIVLVIQSLCKQRRDSIEQFGNAGRADLVAKETRELDILTKFLPAQLSREEVEGIVQKAIQETAAAGAKDMGKVMKAIMPQVQGKADGKMVSEVVKSLLGA